MKLTFPPSLALFLIILSLPCGALLIGPVHFIRSQPLVDLLDAQHLRDAAQAAIDAGDLPAAQALAERAWDKDQEACEAAADDCQRDTHVLNRIRHMREGWPREAIGGGDSNTVMLRVVSNGVPECELVWTGSNYTLTEFVVGQIVNP